MIQYAALPVTVMGGEVRVMLITSRRTKRWIIPKGWPEKKMSPQDVATLEAYEEAGLKGRVAEEPLGVFHYDKVLKSGRSITCAVETYVFTVERELAVWPERKQRQRRWVSLREAAEMIDEDGLAEMLLCLNENHPPHSCADRNDGGRCTPG